MKIDGNALRSFLPNAERVRPGRKSGVETTWKLIKKLIEIGTFPRGQNERADANRNAWAGVWPDRRTPAQSTLKFHLIQLEERIQDGERR